MPVYDPAAPNDVTPRGMAIYNDQLKAELEPAFNNQFVAIHVDSGDFAVARSTGAAMRALRQRQPQGSLLTMKIGPEPEYGLAARLLTGEMMAGAQK